MMGLRGFRVCTQSAPTLPLDDDGVEDFSASRSHKPSSSSHAPHLGHPGSMLDLTEDEAEAINFHVLSVLHDTKTTFAISAEQPIELHFFRRLFGRLQQQQAIQNQRHNFQFKKEALSTRQSGLSLVKPEQVEVDEGEKIPIQAFTRAMRRLFQVLRGGQDIDPEKYDGDGDGMVGWSEFCYVWKTKRITVKLSLGERVFLIFDDPQSCTLAWFVSCFVLLTITISSVVFILSTVPEFQDHPEDGSEPTPIRSLWFVETVCLIIFAAEYVIRVATSWANRSECFDKALLLEICCGYDHIYQPSAIWRIIKFVLMPGNLVDLAAFLPGIIERMELDKGHGSGLVVLRLVKLTRIARAFRLGKYMEPVIVISRTVKKSTRALYVLAFNLLLGIVIFGSLMFLTEQGDWEPETRTWQRYTGQTWNRTLGEWQDTYAESPFVSIPHTFWWALVTASTVGYGDQFPTTSNGKLVAAILMIWSLVILALPVGVIGGTFTQVWDDFSDEKKEEEAKTRREMEHVAAAIQRIEPSKVSRLLLVEIWNDGSLEWHRKSSPPRTPQQMPVTPEDFMGEAKLELDLPEDRPKTGKMTVPLSPNFARVRRSITGSVTVRYEWIPGVSRSSCSTPADRSPVSSENDAPTKGEDEQALQYESEEEEPIELSGSLKLTVMSADRLISTPSHHRGGKPNPYAIVVCYPRSPPAGEPLRPTVWRTASHRATQRPVWEATHCFKFVWYAMSPTTDIRSMVPPDKPEVPVKEAPRMFVLGAKARSKTKESVEICGGPQRSQVAVPSGVPVRSVQDSYDDEVLASRAAADDAFRIGYQRGLTNPLPAARNLGIRPCSAPHRRRHNKGGSATSPPPPGGLAWPQGGLGTNAEVLSLLRSLAGTLPNLAHEMKQVREEVRSLSARVDRVAESAGVSGGSGGTAPQAWPDASGGDGISPAAVGSRRDPIAGEQFQLLAEGCPTGSTADVGCAHASDGSSPSNLQVLVSDVEDALGSGGGEAVDPFEVQHGADAAVVVAVDGSVPLTPGEVQDT